jgi:hypothetical protein
MDRKLKPPVHLFVYNQIIMPRKKFSEAEQELLRANKHVLRVSTTNITYAPQFKVHALERDRAGLSPQSIFAEAGFPVTILLDVPKTCIKAWRKIHAIKGNAGLLHSERGKSKKGGRPKKERLDPSRMTLQEQVEYYRLKSEYRDLENDFLARARGIKRIPFVYHPEQNTNS